MMPFPQTNPGNQPQQPYGSPAQGASRTLYDLEQIVLAANADSELILRQAFGITDAMIAQGLPVVLAAAKSEAASWQAGIQRNGGPSARVSAALHIVEVLRDNVDQILSFVPQSVASPDAATATALIGALRGSIARALQTSSSGKKHLMDFGSWQRSRSISTVDAGGNLVRIGLASEDLLPPELFGGLVWAGYGVGAAMPVLGRAIATNTGKEFLFGASIVLGSFLANWLHSYFLRGAKRSMHQETSGALEAALKAGDDPLTVLRFVLEAHHNFTRRTLEKFSPFEHVDRVSASPGFLSGEEMRIRFLEASDAVYDVCQQVLQLPPSGGRAAAVLNSDPVQALKPVQRQRWNQAMEVLPNIYANYNVPGLQRLDSNLTRDFVALSQIVLRLANYVRESPTADSGSLSFQKTEIANVINRFDGWGNLGTKLFNKLFIGLNNSLPVLKLASWGLVVWFAIWAISL